MPNKKQGSFHIYVHTFCRMRLSMPEPQPPAPESPAYAQIDPQHKNPAPSDADYSSQVASSEHQASFAFQIDPTHTPSERAWTRIMRLSRSINVSCIVSG